MTWWANFSRSYLLGPNGLSVFRGILGFVLPFLLHRPEPRLHVMAFCLFLLGVGTDYFDGFLARAYGLETQFGRFMDPLADKVLILAPLVTFGFMGFYSLWWVVPIFIREVVVTFCRIGWLLEGKAIGAEKFGKVKLGFQVATVIAAFFYFITLDFSFLQRFTAFCKAFTFFSLFVAIFLTLVSGISFLVHHRSDFQSQAFARYVSALGVGLIPIIPGTWGSALGVALFFLIQWNAWLYLVTFLSIFFAGYWAVSQLDLSQEKDPHFVVVDETVGMLVVLAEISPTFLTVAGGFLLFRFFDVVKPYPLRRLEKLPGYWGIVCDDLGAGLYAWIVLQIAVRLFQAT
jgi:CDP-diacylglycerol--glycerol-3-phosphate 3-phosphatidyltransferase